MADRLIERRYVCVVGRSGTGKSSLVAAGALPALRKALPGLSYLRFTPQNDPFARLADALDRLMPEERLRSREAPRVERLADELRADPGKALGLHLPALAPLLVFADQFEELFTQTPEGSRPAFRAV